MVSMAAAGDKLSIEKIKNGPYPPRATDFFHFLYFDPISRAPKGVRGGLGWYQKTAPSITYTTI